MLTMEQLERRTRLIGASEVGAILGLSRFKTASDVWLSKRRGPNLELPPIVPPTEDVPGEVNARTIGNVVESSIVELYRIATPEVTSVEPGVALVSAHHPWLGATPDRIVKLGPAERGLECKAVGRYMLGDWDAEDDGLPPAVACQCLAGMHVTGLSRWDVAMLSGTDFRVLPVERDQEAIDAMVEACDWFWREYVLGDKAPPPGTGAAANRLVSARWPECSGEVVDVGNDSEVLDIVRQLLEAKGDADDAEQREAIAKAKLRERVGENKGIRGPFGSFQAPMRRGAPRWKDIAEHLHGGPVPDDVVDKFRGADARTGGTLYASKK